MTKDDSPDLSVDPACLSPRERQVAERLALGSSCREVAAELGIGAKTADTHRAHVLRKLGLRNVADLARWAIAWEIIAVAPRSRQKAEAA